MPFDGSGNFTRSYNFTADKNASIKIQSVRMDAEFDNFATAMNQVLLRNGVTPLTGDLKVGGNLVTNVAAGAVNAPSITFAADTTTGFFSPAAGTVAVSILGVERARFTANGFALAGVATMRAILETAIISATAISGTVVLDAKTQAVIVFDANAAGNWVFNVRGDGTTTLDSLMAINQTLTLAVEVPQGNPAFYCTSITIDGNAPAQLKWFNVGGAPTSGNISGVDVYTITVIKKAAATFYVRASQTQAK